MVPDSKLAREATELVRDTESPLLFNHSTRVYYFGSLAGKQRGLKFDHVEPPRSLWRREAKFRASQYKFARAPGAIMCLRLCAT